MSLVVAALMIVASAAIIARPLLNPSPSADGPSDRAAELLEREKNVALLAIREADFDHAMGKLSDEDHDALVRIYEQRALDAMAQGMRDNLAPSDLAETLGVGVAAHEAVPMAIYCFLANANSFTATVEAGVYVGGDTDTIACMAGAIAGARHGAAAIPPDWLRAVREPEFTPERIAQIARDLHAAAS